MTHDVGALVAIALAAATVNGALGHGFSSITVPLALLFHPAAVLNPALVPIEVGINAAMLGLARRSVPVVWRRVAPMLLGLVPGVLAGTWLLASVDAAWLKLVVYAVLLPLILLQAAGVRRPVGTGRAVGVPFGAGVGVVYAVTTVSGPPLSLLLNNQGLVKDEFRAALGLIRLAESSFTAAAYGVAGLYTARSTPLMTAVAPVVLVGLPLGALLVRRVSAEKFRRVCMSFDVWIVGFGLARVLIGLGLAEAVVAWSVMLVAVVLDATLLVAFFRQLRQQHEVA